MSSIQFLGAAGCVTGSRHLVEHAGRRVLLDCGLFQGTRELRERNWEPFPVPPDSIDAVVLSHAHIDHTGWFPRLVKQGFRGPAWCTPATADLCQIMLPDSGRIQEEEAAYANKKKYSKHAPALPLYTEADAEASLQRLEPVRYGRPREIGPGITLTLYRAGHILGSAIVQLDLDGPDGGPGPGAAARKTLVFSGDLGRYGMPIIPDPEPVARATHVLVECTYGDRRHEEEHPREELKKIVRRIVEQKSVLLIPAFAIGRTQDVLYHLRQLQLAGEIAAEIPMYVDSPMACDATPLYLSHREEHDQEMVKMLVEGQEPLHPEKIHFARSVNDSKAINDRKGPLIVISPSGMATAGRVLHHLKKRLPDPRATVLFVGYQAVGSRGRTLLEGAEQVRIHGEDVPVRAQVTKIPGFSAHADFMETDRWLSSLAQPPETTFLVHGEPEALEATRARLQARSWRAHVPAHLEKVEL
jgi:metallo-beta-lactamase family protein